MEDREIINLYLNRNMNAINETVSKYGNYCKTIAKNVLGNNEDAEECVNDTFLNAWNSIPPHKPHILSTYLGKITRNLCFDKCKHNKASKRGGGQIEQVLEELSECIASDNSVEKEVDRMELTNIVNNFLNTLSQEKCNLFLCRYWYAYSVSEIATKFEMTETNVSVTLNRIRGKLKDYFIERGYEI